MMNKMKQLWVNFHKKPDLWFFYAFLLSATLSIRKTLWLLPLKETFNEYSGVYIYLSDIFLVLTLFFYILYNNNILLSITHTFTTLNCSTWNNIKKAVKNVPCGTISLNIANSKLYKQVIHSFFQNIPLYISFFSFISILWATNKPIASFRSIKLLEFVLLFYYVKNTFSFSKMFHVEHYNNNNQDCSTWNILKSVFQIIIGVAAVQSIIGIFQFILQKSIGLTILKESAFSASMPGVAKIILNNKPYIRSYGLLPHPNILAGFLVFSIIITFIYFKLFHVKQFKGERSTVPRGTILNAILFLQTVALILTFSKSGILALCVSIIYINLIVPRPYANEAGETIINKIKMFHVEHFKEIAILLLLITLIFTLYKPNFHFFLLQSIQERLFYLNVSRETFILNPLLGQGIGQFVINLSQMPIAQWQLQPVHNVYLLILNELGMFVFAAFIYFLIKLFHVEQFNEHTDSCIVPRGTITPYIYYVKSILLGFTLIMLFDHYFWDIQQGMFIFWFVLGII